MGIPFHALNSIQVVAGCDVHNQIPPPPPVGPLPAPHVIVYMMGLADPTTTKTSATVKMGWGFSIGRQHDLGRGLYHFAANLLLPLVDLGSGNKSEFGCASVSIGACGAGLEKARLAVGVIPFVGLNLQLDCNDVPCAMPTSVCIASFNTVHAGLTLTDVLAGFAAMVVDIAITWLVGEIAGAIASGLGSLAVGALGEVLALLGPEALLIGGLAGIVAGPVIHDAAKMVIGWLIGTPLGYSYTGTVAGVPLGPGSTYGGKLNDIINDHISPTPKPPAAPPPAPAGSSTPRTPAPTR
ncbi:MAG TPA: hypothetical protein VHO67_17910 [Polyangia bacterium]|nr:hypothetical protein [Polyangia bacterium]